MQKFCIQKTYISSIYDLINICIHFLQFIHRLYAQKTYKGCSVSSFYRFCIVCTLFVCTENIQRLFQLTICIGFVQFVHCRYKKHTFQVSSRFQFKLWTSFVHSVHFLYICRNVMYIFCTFIIIQSFDLYNLCIQNIQFLCFV